MVAPNKNFTHHLPITIEKPDAPQKERKSGSKWGFSVIVMLSLFIGITMGLKELIERYLSPEFPIEDQYLIEKTIEEAEDIAKRHAEWVVYKLVAKNSGKRPCLRCPNNVSAVTLNIGETWKYGITTAREARYNRKFYQTLRLDFIIIEEGDYTTCKAIEVTLILGYKHLKESSKLEVKLEKPPGNAIKG